MSGVVNWMCRLGDGGGVGRECCSERGGIGGNCREVDGRDGGELDESGG